MMQIKRACRLSSQTAPQHETHARVASRCKRDTKWEKRQTLHRTRVLFLSLALSLLKRIGWLVGWRKLALRTHDTHEQACSHKDLISSQRRSLAFTHPMQTFAKTASVPLVANVVMRFVLCNTRIAAPCVVMSTMVVVVVGISLDRMRETGRGFFAVELTECVCRRLID